MREIRLDDPAAEWFLEQEPLPESVMQFLNQVDKHNQKVRTIVYER